MQQNFAAWLVVVVAATMTSAADLQTQSDPAAQHLDLKPLTGRFVLRLPEKADRLYVADVSGDWREEIVVLNGSELHVYSNSEPNPHPDHKRLWENRNYRRLKQAHNYYSP